MAELATASLIREEKTKRVTEVQEKLRAAKMAIVTDYRGLTVTQMTRLRREIREASGEYQVIKNTLARRALKDTAYGSLDSLLEGPNGWVFAYEDPVTLSKALHERPRDPVLPLLPAVVRWIGRAESEAE